MATIDQYKRFVASEPEAQIEYRTIELYHPQFSQTYRFVNTYNNITATLESNAPRDSGDVLFEAATFKVEEPSERNDNDQILTVTAGIQDGKIREMVDSISGTGFLDQINVVYRVYYSGDLTQPAKTPLYLYASGINFDNQKASFTAEDTDLNTKRSGVLYTTEFFPGLA